MMLLNMKLQCPSTALQYYCLAIFFCIANDDNGVTHRCKMWSDYYGFYLHGRTYGSQEGPMLGKILYRHGEIANLPRIT